MYLNSFRPHIDHMKGRDRIKKQWRDLLGGKLRQRWRKLKWQDVLLPDGDGEYLAGLLEERYGIDRREALLQVFEFESDL